jgi:hypothetical protein
MMPLLSLTHRPALQPNSDLLARVLQVAAPSMQALRTSPMGGEAYGALEVVSIAVTDAADHDEAFLALWKATTCMAEEWPYEVWDARMVGDVMHNFYAVDFTFWTAPIERSAVAFTDTLRDSAQAVIGEQFSPTLARAPYPPQRFPPQHNTAHDFDPRGLEGLHYLLPTQLQSILCDRWNALQGLFLAGDRWYLVEWWTNS